MSLAAELKTTGTMAPAAPCLGAVINRNVEAYSPAIADNSHI
jgi:hypothetical protein